MFGTDKRELEVCVKLSGNNGEAMEVSEQGNDKIRDVLTEKNTTFLVQ